MVYQNLSKWGFSSTSVAEVFARFGTEGFQDSICYHFSFLIRLNSNEAEHFPTAGKVLQEGNTS